MTKRKEHNIESNCVSFDDDCWNETQNQETYRTIYDYETKIVQKTGEKFVEYLKQKLGLNE